MPPPVSRPIISAPIIARPRFLFALVVAVVGRRSSDYFHLGLRVTATDLANRPPAPRHPHPSCLRLNHPLVSTTPSSTPLALIEARFNAFVSNRVQKPVRDLPTIQLHLAYWETGFSREARFV
ncbi:hypothetical protein V9T40_011772 [Parthenolecanium corni]|uniref:Uncharacterized protein n=1 Tax=Parthenolecanium corni TaxID=536013 RepID=A0AAN9T7P2_9HEMI